MHTVESLLLSCAELSSMALDQSTLDQSLPAGSEAQRSSMTISEALAATLTQALSQKRLTLGVMDCAKLLGCAPNRAMMCVLPEMSVDDVAVHIQHMLIRSFCRENDIRLLTVKDEQRLLSLVREDKDMHDVQVSNISCILVEYPADGNSEADDFVCGYHDIIVARDILPKPIIQLPD